MNATLSVRECLRYGWTTFKQRPWFLIGVTLLICVVNALIPGPKEGQAIPLMAAFFVLSMVVGALVQLGSVHFSLRAHDSITSASLKDLWRPDLYLHFLGASIAGFVIIGVPLLALWGIAAALYFFVSWVAFAVAIVPALIVTVVVGLALYFFSYIVVDKHAGPIVAIKESFRITKGYRWKLFQLTIMIGLVNLLGVICLIVGLLVSLPVSVLATVHAYRVLGRTKDASPTPAVSESLPATA